MTYKDKEKRKKYLKDWRKNNKKQIKQYSAGYYKKNKERILKRDKIWREKNKQSVKEYYKNKRKNNLEYYRKHDRERYIKNKNIMSGYQRKYRENPKNREKRNKYYRNYYHKYKKRWIGYVNKWKINNPEKIKEYRIQNKDRIEQWQKEWKKKNIGKLRLQWARRRTLRLNAEGSYSIEEWDRLLHLVEGVCPCCKKFVGEDKLTVDHIIPLSKNGTNYIENLQPLCLTCNIIKKDRHSIDYLTPFLNNKLVSVKQIKLLH